MKRAAANGRYSTTNPKAIRPAADVRRGSEKAAQAAKERAGRARDELTAFKNR